MSIAIRHYRNTHLGDEVEAVQLTTDNVDEVAAWCEGLAVQEQDSLSGEIYVGVNVPTIMGNLRASEFDWVVKSPRGTFYPHKPGAFDDAFQIT